MNELCMLTCSLMCYWGMYEKKMCMVVEVERGIKRIGKLPNVPCKWALFRISNMMSGSGFEYRLRFHAVTRPALNIQILFHTQYLLHSQFNPKSDEPITPYLIS